MPAPASQVSSSPLTSEELELWNLLEHDVADADSVAAFIPIVNPRYSRPNHLKPLTDLIYDAAKYGDIRGVTSTPPRHGKSETILHSIPWLLSRDAAVFPFAGPTKTHAYVTYEASFGHDQSQKALDACKSVGVPLRRDMQRRDRWYTPEGGGFIATGIGGPLTGKGIDGCLFIDDPFKNRAEAESRVIRNKVWDWFTSVANTRIEPGGSIVCNMARWHDDDIIGRLTMPEYADQLVIKYRVVNLPAINERGEPLWPERWPLKYLDIRRREIGEYDWASLFLGKPRPKGGRLFREPARYRFADVDGARIVIGGDPAATAKTASHPSAAVVLAVKQKKSAIPGERVWSADVLDVEVGRWEIPELARRWVALQRKWHAPFFVEAQGGFKSVPQTMREVASNLKGGGRLDVIDVAATTDKFVRAQGAAAAWNDARIRVPLDAAEHPWLVPFLRRVQLFTGVGDDIDEVDALSHVWNESTGITTAGVVNRGVY